MAAFYLPITLALSKHCKAQNILLFCTISPCAPAMVAKAKNIAFSLLLSVPSWVSATNSASVKEIGIVIGHD